MSLARLAGALSARVAWELRRAGVVLSRRLGVAWVLAALGAGAVMVAWQVRQSIGMQVAALADAQRQRAQPVPTLASTDALADRVAAFRAVLVAADDVPGLLQDLLDSAQQRGLRVARGEYRASADDGGGFVRQRLLMPIVGDAAAMQSFVLDSLRGHPALAVESVQFKRESAATSVLEARIHWVLFVRPAGAAAAKR